MAVRALILLNIEEVSDGLAAGPRLSCVASVVRTAWVIARLWHSLLADLMTAYGVFGLSALCRTCLVTGRIGLNLLSVV